MKLKFIKTLLVSISLICGSIFAQADTETIYLDFGDGQDKSYSQEDVFYNVIPSGFAASINGGAAGNSMLLQTSANTASGVTLTITEPFAASTTLYAGGGVDNPSTPVAAFNLSSLSGDSLYVNDTNPTAAFTLSGLTKGHSYKFTVFASRADATDIRSGDYIIKGASTETVTLNASNNTSNIVSTGYISPKSDGTIEFRISKAASNTNGAGIALINGLEIEVASPK